MFETCPGLYVVALQQRELPLDAGNLGLRAARIVFLHQAARLGEMGGRGGKIPGPRQGQGVGWQQGRSEDLEIQFGKHVERLAEFRDRLRVLALDDPRHG